MRQVPEPDHEEWVARMRELAQLDAGELLQLPPFEVFGLAEPLVPPAALAETGRVNGVWQMIALAYGDWADPAGPFVTVTSAAVRHGAGGLSPEADLARAIDRERNRVAEHTGVDEEEPPGPPGYCHEDLRVGKLKVRGLVCSHGTVWAARLHAGQAEVTVVGRGISPGSVLLGPVTDLGPYVRGRGEMLARLAERLQQPPVLEPADGVAAYRALAEAVLESHARRLAALLAGREPRRRAGEGATRHALWQRAVREQARISGADERQADDVVTLVVNHLIHLHDEAVWFTADRRLREAAIDETLRHAVLGEDVPSLPAQRAWARYWAHRTGHAAHDPGRALQALQAELAVGQPLSSGWLQAWLAWARER
jgi:hypothetical protein